MIWSATDATAQDEPAVFEPENQVASTIATATVSEPEVETDELELYHRATMNLAAVTVRIPPHL